MTTRARFLSSLAVAGLLAFALQPAQAAELSLAKLKLKIDLSQTTVSGISSGAYMAGQFQVAYSDIVKGAGIVAGGPYACAEVSPGGLAPAVVALKRCMDTSLGAPDVPALVANAQAREKAKDIDPLANLAQSRIYLFNGDNDKTVTRPVAEATAQFYKAVGVPDANFKYVKLPKAAHAYITDGYGAACDFIPKEGQKSEYINNCQYDQAGDILKHLYPDTRTPNAPEAAKKVALFDQTPFVGDTSRTGMATSGYIYVPEACQQGQTCKIHVAFHGCQMPANLIGDHFATKTDYNRWADVNNLVVLYPQIDSTAKPSSNPKACWDWFAYTGYDFARKGGFQMTAIRKMLGALADEQ
ncbi:extracellular catalytic domain type 2 short-chain-length polyhydroxyalkanoate depolymerase [Azospirillum agricola]|uniref:extracellular catalytic domain type 2 short-chain-length polyhydroxyalkanoate depolymerase n=1 Tax=Azospirillum agricola TaxID=1720247 RepID=UPI000A0F3D01|nr:PHB depolymerase family esterase [Azospirillum agricola]SMH60301.1 poly(3-hydroxybutyrate) depolymerase [Azospirillum lipoferum]